MNEQFPQILKKNLLAIRQTRPIVHHITNLVTINSCANITTAIGASPVMASAKEEAGQITASSSALVLNTGTPDHNRIITTVLSGKSANANNIPIILDPVGVGATDFRLEHLKKLIHEVQPSIIKGNLAELKTLSGISLKINGLIDSVDKEDASTLDTLKELSKRLNCVIALTGKEDLITDGKRVCRIKRGTDMFTFISGAGCITSSVMGAFAAVEKDMFIVAVCALYTMAICGEKSAKVSNGPGDFYPNLLNYVFNLHNCDIDEEGVLFE